nr:C39 family peptidase [uncultured Acetatifactor sp.]
MEIYYNSTDSEYYYTLGRAYADELNKLRYSSNVDFENIVFIGQVADKLFVTDGKNVDVILEMPVEKMPTVSVSELEEICTNLTVDESTDYAVICEPELDNVFTTQNIMPLVSIKDTRSLDVPHVEQTGVCGVAAWAAVLNYRFGTSYTNDSLALEMANGYTNGKYNAPNMGDYKNFANDKYDADCVYTTPPSFTTVLNTIADKKPIMGYWESGSGTNFSTHAILITGFSYLNSVPADRYYIVKNPWYTYTQWISVTDPDSVTYVNGTRTWSLKSAVY